MPVPWIPAPQSELLYVALGTARSRCLTFMVALQLWAQSHKKAVHCWSDTFKTSPSEPSAVEKFLHGTVISALPSPVLTLGEGSVPSVGELCLMHAAKAQLSQIPVLRAFIAALFLHSQPAHRAVTLWSLSLTHKHKIKYHFSDIQSSYWLRCWWIAVTLPLLCMSQHQELLCHPSCVSPKGEPQGCDHL